MHKKYRYTRKSIVTCFTLCPEKMSAVPKAISLGLFFSCCLVGTRGHVWNNDCESGSALLGLDKLPALKRILEPTDTFIERVNEECRKHLMAFQERVNNLYLTPGVSDYWALQSEAFDFRIDFQLFSNETFCFLHVIRPRVCQ